MIDNVHLIGIGGTGLSAIARVLLEQGVRVSGSDRQHSPMADEIARLGATIHTGHRPENISGASLVVRSSAVSDDNPEVQAALQKGIPVLKRSEFLPLMLADFDVIAIAGTHGKTTTTAMLAWTLTYLGQDPSYIIGGISQDLSSNAHSGRSRFFVIEADEYDYMFLGLNPFIAVVTNIEHDHPDCFPTPESFYSAFRQFADRIIPTGILITSYENPGASRLHAEMSDSSLNNLTYSLNGSGDFRARDLVALPDQGYRFTALLPGHRQVLVELRVPGIHNVSNALAALAVIDRLELDPMIAAQALSRFSGAGRRFQIAGAASGIKIIDDYAHHPTEIKATLQAARSRYPGRRIWAVWQPHTFSRTRRLLHSFARAFDDADHVVVTAIYPAREPAPADGFSARHVVESMSHPSVLYASDLDEARRILFPMLLPGDIVLVLSAGDAPVLSAALLSDLRQPERQNHD